MASRQMSQTNLCENINKTCEWTSNFYQPWQIRGKEIGYVNLNRNNFQLHNF